MTFVFLEAVNVTGCGVRLNEAVTGTMALSIFLVFSDTALYKAGCVGKNVEDYASLVNMFSLSKVSTSIL